MSSHESQHALLAAVEGMPPESELPHGAIVGAVHVSHALTLDQCQTVEPWAFGPVVNVIDRVAALRCPVPHRGALSIWRIGDAALGDVRAQLGEAEVITNDVSHLPTRAQAPATINVRHRSASEGYARPVS